MFVAGLDENGLGPLLGPLTVTCATLEVRSYDRARLWRLGSGLGLDDSKAVSGFGKMTHAESVVLALCQAQTGQLPRHADELLAFLERGPETLAAHCPASSKPQCWSEPVALPCFGGDLANGQNILAKLAKRGLRIASVQTRVACTKRLNDALAQGTSRVELDLALMEELIVATRAQLTEDFSAICGMVGGIRDYPKRLARLKVTPLPGARGTLAFNAEGVGTVSFEIDADARHLPVALASMVGKYVREVWMERQNRFYRTQDASLAAVSGYHDPVTRRFIEASGPLRRRLAIAQDCFERRSLGTLDAASLFSA